MGTLTYEFDAANRVAAMGGSLARVVLPTAATGVYDAANRLIQWNGTTLTYDWNGNLTNDGANTFTWNARNELTGVTGSGLVAGFAYDSGGRRIQSTVNGATVGYLYDGVNAVQELSGGSAVANLLYASGVDGLIQRSSGAGSRVPVTDLNGSVLAMSDPSGSLEAQYSYEPFGKVTVTGASANRAQYTGRENDGTGLFYYRARYYHPVLSRFISEDPTGFGGGDVNLYAYVGNSPTNGRDPMGTALMGILGGAFAGFGPFITLMTQVAAVGLGGVAALTAAKMMGQPNGGGDSWRPGDAVRELRDDIPRELVNANRERRVSYIRERLERIRERARRNRDPWDFTEVEENGSTAFVGPTHSVVIDSSGNVSMGRHSQFQGQIPVGLPPLI